MPSTYSTNLKIELMATGENSGTWGTVTNTNLGTALEQAIVGYGNPDFVTDANLTITLSDSNSLQAARALVLNVTSTASLTVTRELIVPTIQKQYIVQNNTSGSQSITVKTSAGTGVTIPNGKKMHVYVNGTDVVQMDDFALIFNVDNLTLDGNTLSSTNTNGNIVLAPNGNGDVQLDADTVRVGDSNVNVTITSNGTADLILNTNAGTNSGSITIEDGVNGNIIIAPNGTGQVQISNAALDLTTIEVTNIKAKDGTASMTLADSTGVVTFSKATVIEATDNTNAALRITQLGTGNALLVEDSANPDTTPFVVTATGDVGIGTSSPATGLSLLKYGSQWTNHTSNPYPQPAGNTFLQMETVAAQDNWFGFTGSYGTTSGSANILLQVNLNNFSQQAGNYIASEAQGSIAADLTFGKMVAGASSGATSTKSEQMRIQGSTGNVGIGTNNPASKLHIQSTVGTAEILINLQTVWSSPSGNKSIRWFDGSGALGAIAVNYTAPQAAMTFGSLYNSGYNTTDLMTLTPTGLGIGTNNPGFKLDVAALQAVFRLASTTGTNPVYMFTTNTGGDFYVGRDNSTGTTFGSNTAYTSVLWSAGAYPMAFFTNGTEKMRLDSSGNLGLGVTPKTDWSADYDAFQLGGGSSLSAHTSTSLNFTVLASNQYINTSSVAKFIHDGYAPRYLQRGDTGEHYWYTTNSGLAGGNVTNTQSMTLDALGNLGVGETSPSTYGKITLKGGKFSLVTDTAAERRVSFWSTANGNSENAYIQVQNDGATTNTGEMLFATKNSGGTLAERARITAGGNLLVGTDNSAENAGLGMKVLNTGGTVALVSSASDSSQQGFEMYSTTAAAYRLYINYAGTINATSTTISAISDQRLKENIQDLDVGLDKIMALKPRKFDWKTGKGKDIKGDRGWIAQEFEQVFPDLIDEWRDPAPEGEEPYKSVRADLIPVLVKAIQEQQAMIEELKAKVAALKGA